MTTEFDSQIIMVRHGETTWNIEGKIQGNGNGAELTPLGINQAHAAGQQLKHQFNGRNVQIWSSDLTRASATAKIIAGYLSYPENDIRYDPRLQEANHGSLNGMLPDEYKVIESYQRFKELPPEQQFFTAMDPKKGESQERVAARIMAVFSQIRSQSFEGIIILVTHGGIIKAAQTALTKNFSPPNVNNGEGIIIERSDLKPFRLPEITKSSA